MLAILGILAQLLSAAPAPAPVDVNTVIARCEAALGGQTRALPGRTVVVDPGLICFRGDMTKGATALAQAIAATPEGSALTLYADSGGGSVTVSLPAGEAIARRMVTIVTGPLCASSCANSLFLSAARRIIGPDSVVGFHGGTMPMNEAMSQEITGVMASAPAAVREAAIELEGRRLQAEVARQEALLRSVGVDPQFFHRFYRDGAALGPAWKGCRPDDGLVVFSAGFLAARGATVEQDLGPKTQAQVDALPVSRGRACYQP